MNTTFMLVVTSLLLVIVLILVFMPSYRRELEEKRAKEDEDNTIKPGYYWYEDDTFSEKRIPDKTIKAIVELVEDGFIYGDLTASELFSIKEQQLTWEEAKKFFEDFSYPCKENEKIVWYDIHQLSKVEKNCYGRVIEALITLNKPSRYRGQWTCSECCSLRENAFIMDFHYHDSFDTPKVNINAVRPVIAMKCSDVFSLIVTY